MGTDDDLITFQGYPWALYEVSERLGYWLPTIIIGNCWNSHAVLQHASFIVPKGFITAENIVYLPFICQISMCTGGRGGGRWTMSPSLALTLNPISETKGIRKTDSALVKTGDIELLVTAQEGQVKYEPHPSTASVTHLWRWRSNKNLKFSDYKWRHWVSCLFLLNTSKTATKPWLKDDIISIIPAG